MHLPVLLRLGAQQADRDGNRRLFIEGFESGQPLAVAPVEQAELVARLSPHDVPQVMGLTLGEGNRGVLRQFVVDIKARQLYIIISRHEWH